jgi:phage tail-like protein
MKRVEIERLLPSVIERTVQLRGPLAAILDVMEALHLPSEAALARFDAAFDPRRTSDDFVPYLARWVDMDRLFDQPRGPATSQRSRRAISTGSGRLRELVASAAYLSRWRGTAKGLQRFLRTATGENDFDIKENVDGDGRPKAFHFVVIAPASISPHQRLIKRIIESEKPAYVTYELVIRAEEMKP